MANPHKPARIQAKEAGLRLINTLIELIAHLLSLAGLLAGIKVLEKFVHRLWDQDYLFFNRIKLKYILMPLTWCFWSVSWVGAYTI